MSEMSNLNSENNDINRDGHAGEGSSPGRCSLVQQPEPSLHPTTVRTKWSKNLYKIAMECFFRSKTFDDDGKLIRGYRQQMMQEKKENGVFEITKQRLCDQARTIRKNSWLSDLELENIQRVTEAESETVNESIYGVEEIQTEKGIVRTSKRKEQIADDSDETINNVAANAGTLDEETQPIIAQLNKILAGGRNTDGIFLEKFDMSTLNGTTNIIPTNNLIKASGFWVADQLGHKKYEGERKQLKRSWWKRCIREDIKQQKKDINILERVQKGQIGAHRR